MNSKSFIASHGDGRLLVLAGGERGEEAGEADVEHGLDPVALDEARGRDGGHAEPGDGVEGRAVALNGVPLNRSEKESRRESSHLVVRCWDR